MTMDDIKFDKRNYRIHDKKNKELIKKSLLENGAARSIVIDSEGVIIGGNGVYEASQQLQIPTQVVETDGSKLLVVKRTDLKTSDPKRKRLAVMDNSTSDSSTFDTVALSEDFKIEDINDMGVNMIGLDYADISDEKLSDDEKEGMSVGSEKDLIVCPVCGHINEKGAFQAYDHSTEEAEES